MTMPARFITRTGKQTFLAAGWTGPCGPDGRHFGRNVIGDGSLFESGLAILSQRYDVTCDRCGASAKAAGASFSSSRDALFSTDSGKPEPGDLFFQDYDCRNDGCVAGWVNCDGRHLIAVLPNGSRWDIDSRASNCTMRDDKVHRCWVRHGDPAVPGAIHVDKSGYTCAAGAGSIDADAGTPKAWHGFLHNGTWKGPDVPQT